ncbi:MAG: cytochrome P450 [Myxococcota bacterium]
MLPLNPLQRKVRYELGLPVLTGAFPLVGHVPAVMSDPPGVVAAGTRQLGKLFWFEMGFGRHRTLVYAGNDAHQLFRSAGVESSHFWEDLPLFFGRSLLVVDGAVHRHMRSPMNKPFSPMGLHKAGISRIARQAIIDRVSTWPRQKELTILTETQEITLAIIFGIIGIRPEELSVWRKKFRLYMLSALNVPVDVIGSPTWLARRARAWIDEQLRSMIEATRRDPNATGLLAELVRGRDEEGLALTEQELLDNVRLLVLAGHETTASALAWMMLFLAHHPRYWDQLCEEARGLDDVPTSYEQLSQCPLARALFRESVRMYPPVYAESRRVREPIELDGRTIPPGTRIHISLYHLARDPAAFDQPDRFDPQRWLKRDHKLTPIETSQFGGGHHFCLGYHLALLEGVQLAIAAARALDDAGLRPALRSDRMPSPVYVPLTHPPARTRILLRR